MPLEEREIRRNREGLTRFDHIAVGVWDVANVLPFFEDELGGKPLVGTPGPQFTSAQWEYAHGAKLEAIAPPVHLEGEQLRSNFMHSFLESGGPRIHHVTFKVPNLDEAMASAKANGWKVVGVNKQSPSWLEAFIHPKQDGVGIVVQLAEHHPEKIPEWLDRVFGDPEWLRSLGSSFKLPKFGNEEPFVSIVGLHVSVHSRNRDAAMRLWRGTLKGTPREINAGLVAFSWAESPMQIFLHINHNQTEGPLYIEIQQNRPWTRIPSSLLLTQPSSAGLLPAPHPVLGVSFLLTTQSSCHL